MIRKSLFWGLTLVLIAALFSLIVRSRRLEKEQAAGAAEVVQESQQTPTRVLAPRDLVLSPSKMRLDKDPASLNVAQTAWHEIEVHNNGKVAYSGIQLRLDYLDANGKSRAIKNYIVNKTIKPGDHLKLTDIRIDGLPDRAVDCRIGIAYADIGTELLSK